MSPLHLLQAYVMRHSGLEAYVSLEHSNPTREGPSADRRAEFYSGVPCDTVRALHRLYWMDFQLYEYDPGDFLGLCQAD